MTAKGMLRSPLNIFLSDTWFIDLMTKASESNEYHFFLDYEIKPMPFNKQISTNQEIFHPHKCWYAFELSQGWAASSISFSLE